MTVSSISAHHWPAILQLQAEAYAGTVEPESLDILQSKWHASPETCFVYLHEEKVAGYLLAHPLANAELPKLHHHAATTKVSHSPTLFIHDLAIAPLHIGKGIGALLLQQLLNTAHSINAQKVMLISLKEAVAFWQKMGFVANNKPISSDYGLGAKAMSYDFGSY